MKTVLVFINKKTPFVYRTVAGDNTLRVPSSGRRTRQIPIEIRFATFRNGESGAVLIATDRPVSLNEILDAHQQLIAGKRTVSHKS
ncbi:hypothetical protein [Phytobacter diazotrophicus]|uniref:hypothetical protein n=1 Tax=Phytobacter diazotrophicus TaxID=395631 RepID=UPI002FF66D46